MKKLSMRLIALVMAICFLPVFALAEGSDTSESEWVNFLLVCNEGMTNNKGNAGNTMMVIAMNPQTGIIRLMMFTWDTFVDYEGYDVPQKLDMPFRNNGPEEAMKVFNDNFGVDISLYMSLNYLNLATLIDDYGGVDVDISRAERNALNGQVASKSIRLKEEIGTGLLSQAVVDMLANEYYLTEFGPDTHLNGLQAVGFGWLQYDSVYNCCEREVEVIAALFDRVALTINDTLVFYTDDTGYPEDVRGRRVINLDNMSDDDYDFLRLQMAPIFDTSFHNLTEDAIKSISVALARVAYKASRQGVDIFESLECKVMPLEAKNEYDIIAGAKGHIIDKDANTAAMQEFLFGDR